MEQNQIPNQNIQQTPQKTNVLAILALIFAFLMPLVGIVLAIIALVQIDKNPNMKGQGLAIAALIISIVIIPIFLVGIGALAYFGILSTERFLPDSCTIAPGIGCKVEVSADGTAEIRLTNGMNKDVTSVTVRLKEECTPKDVDWDQGQELVFNCKVKEGDVGERFREDIQVTYTSVDTGLPRSRTGMIASSYN